MQTRTHIAKSFPAAFAGGTSRALSAALLLGLIGDRRAR
jgi:hypothetical protein